MASKKEKEKAPQEEVAEQVPAEETAEENLPEAEETESPLEKENAELKDQLMRTLAEYDNFRKRSAKEKEALFTDGKAYAVEALLAVADNFERALAAESADPEFKKGMEMIFTQLGESFARLGVTEIDALGKPFDPALHNAVMHVESDEVEESTVTQVFQKGYIMGDKVIRHAMVQVTN